MSNKIRIENEMYEAIRQIKLELESDYGINGPTMQDLITVALKQFIENWNSAETQEKEKLLSELLEHRKNARSRMGRKTI